MANIAIYKFNDGTNTLPIFESSYEYSYTDESNGDGTITRTITSNAIPSSISFKDCEGLVSVSYLNTENINNFSYLFQNCVNLTSVDLYNIVSSHITDMKYMFAGCTGLMTIDLGGLSTANVTDMSGMFMGCSNIFSIDIKNLNTGKVTSMNSMFQNCENLSSLDMTGMNISSLSNIGFMFAGCTNLMSVLFTGLNLNNSMLMNDIFKDCLVLNVVNMDNCAIDDINMMINYLPQREANSGAKLKVNNSDVSGINTTNLGTKNWNLASYEIFVRYIFDKSVYADLVPQFNSGFANYVIIDEAVNGNMVTRAIGHENLKPTMIRFGNPDGSGATGTPAKYHALKELLYIDSSNLNTTQLMFHHCLRLTKVCEMNLTNKVTNMAGMFAICQALHTIEDLNDWDISNVTDMNYMFNQCYSLTSINVSNWNVSKVTNMRSMFAYCNKAETINISGWNTAALTTVRAMFDNCLALRSIMGINELNTSKVTDMYAMFWRCEKLITMDLSGWNVSNVTNMNHMFYYCFELTSVGDLGNWSTGKVTDMNQMFNGCKKLTSLNVRNWDVSKAIGFEYMFNDCIKITTLDLSGWDTRSATSMKYMFNATDGTVMALNSLILGPNWNTSNVTNMECMFNDCANLISMNTDSFNINNWNVSKVTTMNTMFKNCSGLISLDLSNWNVSNVTSMSSLFDTCMSLESVNLSGWNTSKVTNMNYLFNQCQKLKSVNINHFDTSNVTSMTGIFQNCYEIESLDLSNWNVSKVTDMSYMFNAGDGTYLKWHTIKLGPGWRTSSATTMYCMFSDADKLTTIEGLEYFDMSKVTNTGWMFARCKALTSLANIRNWDMSNVTDARGMFSECLALRDLDVSKWNVGKLKVAHDMFNWCRSLPSIDLNNWDVGSITTMSSFLAQCHALTSLDISNWKLNSTAVVSNLIDYCLNLKTININNIKLTRENMTSNTWADDVYLEKIYANDVNTINLLLDADDIEDRKGMSEGIIVVPSSINIPEATMTRLIGRNWTVRNLVVQYTFDANTCENVMPEFNAGFTADKYTVRDEVNDIVIDNIAWEAGCLSIEDGKEYSFPEYPNGKRSEFIPVLENVEYVFDTDYVHVIWYNAAKEILLYSDMRGTNSGLEPTVVSPIGAKYVRIYRGDGVTSDVRAIRGKLITRTIETVTGELPTRIRFGHRSVESATNDTYEAAHGTPEAANALLRVSEISTDELTYMNDMFRECGRVTAIISSKWNTSKVTEMRCAIEGCSSLSILDVSNWDVSKVTYMGWLFNRCKLLDTIDVSKWNTANVTQTQLMFGDCHSVKALDVSNWNMSKVTHAYGMFLGCYKVTTLDVSKWNTSSLKYAYQLFETCQSITALDVSTFDVSKVENLSRMFASCINLTTLNGLGNWKTNSATNMSYMFQDSEKIQSLDIANWNTSNVTTMEGMFRRCYGLTELNVGNWNVSKVRSMSSMFGLCTHITSLDLSKWDVRNVNVMTFLFDDCVRLTEVKGIENWNTSNLSHINGLFNDCIAIKKINLSKWDTSKIISQGELFFAGRDKSGPMALKSLDITNWTLPANNTYTDMFYSATCSTELQYVKCGTPELANVVIPFLPDRTSKEAGALVVNSVSGINTSALLSKNWNLLTVDNATVVAEYKFDERLNNLIPTFNSDFMDYFIIDSKVDTEDYVINDFMQWDEVPVSVNEPMTLDYMEEEIVEDDIETVAAGVVHRVPANNIVTRKIISTGNLPTQMIFGQQENIYTDRAASLLSVSRLNTSNLTTAAYMFKCCLKLKRLDIPNLNMEKVTSMMDFVYHCSNIEYVNVTGYNLNNTRDMTGTFGYCYKLHTIEGISTWTNSTLLGTIYNMFAGDVKLTSLDLSNFNVSNVDSFGSLFYNCKSLSSLNISGWNTSKLRNATWVFYNCQSLTSLDVSGWNTTNVTSMAHMFDSCTKLTSLNVSNFDTSKTTNLEFMFYNCKLLTTVGDVSNWNTIAVTTMNHMFCYCESLASLNVSNWNTANLVYMGSIFAYCQKLTALDLSNWNVSKVIEMTCAFAGSSQLTTVGNLGKWDVSKVRSLYALFSACFSLQSVPGIELWNTKNIQEMHHLFSQCEKLTSLDLSKWDTSNVVDMNRMFAYCKALTTIGDIGNWKTDKVKSFDSMFYACYLLTSINVNTWNTSNATSMRLMFGECNAITSLDVSNFDTRKVTSMYGMFFNCNKLTTLDVSNFDTGNVTDMSAFAGKLWSMKTLNFNNLYATQEKTFIKDDYRFIIDNNNLEKLYVNELWTLVTIIGYITDRTGKTPGKVVTSIRNTIPNDIMVMLTAKNWQIVDIVAQYRFNPDRYENLLPQFNGEFTANDYTVIDTEHVMTLNNMYWESGIIDSTGADAVDNNYSGAARSTYLSIIGGLTYTFNIDYCQVFWYDENKVLLQASGLYGKNEGIANGSKCHAPTDAKYLRIYRGVGSTTNVTISARYIDRILEAVTNNHLPARAVFGLNADSGAYTLREASLIEVLDVNFINIYDASKMFAYCANVKFIRSSWNGTHVQNMYDMFAGCHHLKELDLSKLNTTNVGRMDFTFLACERLTTVGDLSNWNTANVYTMSNMFNGCVELTSLNVSNWNTANVNNMQTMFQNCHKLVSITGINNWNTSKVTTMAYMFTYCYKLASLDLSKWNTSKVTDMYSMFRDCQALTTIGDVSNWDTGRVTNMNIMFAFCCKINGLNVTNWNVGNVRDMHDMFGYCYVLTSLDLSKWNVSNVRDLSGMFVKCYKLTSIGDISNWDVRNVTTTAWMFEHAESLSSINVANWQTDSLTATNSMFTFTYNLQTLDLRNWNTSKVTTTNNMFTNAALTTLDISNFDLSSATDVANMFANTNNLKYLKCNNVDTLNKIKTLLKTRTAADPGYIICKGNANNVDKATFTSKYWNIVNVNEQLKTIARYRFNKTIHKDLIPIFNTGFAGFVEDITTTGDLVTRKIEHLAGVLPTKIKFGYSGAYEDGGNPMSKSLYNVYELDTSNATELTQLFRLCTNLETIECKLIAEKVQYMTGMFNCCYKLKAVDVTGIKTDKVTNFNTVFAGCHVLTSVDVSGWNTSKVTDMHQLFDACHVITEIKGLENWDTSNVTRMSKMFLYNQKVQALNVNNWNTSKVTDMSYMFGYCQQLTSLDLSKWDTRNVISMESLFDNCVNLTSVGDLGNWNTGKVTDMKTMFQYCSKLTSINVANWDVSKVNRFHYMFAYAQSVSTLDVSRWDTSSAIYMAGMFNTCKKLYNIPVSNWNTSNVIDMNWLFGQCDNIVIDVSKWDTGKVKSMQGMFANTGIDNGLNVSNFNTGNVWDMKYMFYNCYGLESLNVNNFDTRKVEDMNYMFEKCKKLKKLDVSNFDTRSLRVADRFLKSLDNIETLNLNNLDFTNASLTDFFGNINNTLTKLYVNRIDTLELIMPTLHDRTGLTAGRIMTSIRDYIPTEIVNELTAKNWIICDTIVNYTFDANVYENLLPEFNFGFTEAEYTVIDEVSEQSITTFTWTRGSISDTTGIDGHIPQEYPDAVRSDYIAIFPTISLKANFDLNYFWYDENKAFISFGHVPAGNAVTAPYKARFMRVYRGTLESTLAIRSKLVNRTIESTNGVLPTMIRFGIEGDGVTTDNPTERSMSLLSVLDMNTRALTVGAYMFRKCKNLSKAYITNFVVPEDAKDIFAECESLLTLDVSGWDVSNVTSLRGTFCYCSNLVEIKGLENWNTSKVQTMYGVFNYDGRLESINVNNWDTGNVTNFEYLFSGCEKLTSLDLSNWDSKNVTTMKGMFGNCLKLTTIGNIEKWDTKNVTDMAYMFNMCQSLTSVNASRWNTSKVTNMIHMFSNCYKLSTVDVSGWDTSKVTDMLYMFNNCNFTTINMSNFDCSKAQNIAGMFRTTNTNNPALIRLNLPTKDLPSNLGDDVLMNQNNLKVVKCENMNNIIKITDYLPTRPASNPGKIITKIPLSQFSDIVISTLANKNWVVTNEGLQVLTRYRFAKSICESLLPGINTASEYAVGDVNYFVEDEYLDNEDVTVKFIETVEDQQTVPANKIVTRTIYYEDGYLYGTANRILFGPHGSSPTYYRKKQCSSLLSVDELDLSQFNTLTGLVRYCTNVKTLNITQYPTVPLAAFESAFASAKSLTTLDVSNFDVSQVNSLMWTFYDMVALTTLTGLENWHTPNLKHMKHLFDRCYNLQSVNVSNFNTINVEDMYCVFANCQKLTEIIGIENFITNNVQNMEGMFANCQLLTSLDVSNFNTSNVLEMGFMFQGCTNLTSLDVSNFNTSKVRDMNKMFEHCDNIQALDVSRWDTSNVENMEALFHYCYALTDLDVSNWNTSKVNEMRSVFRCCQSLTSVDVSNWDTSNVIDISSMFGDCHVMQTLDLSSWDTSKVVEANWFVGAMYNIQTLNLNNIVILDDCTIDSYFTNSNRLERIYMNEIDTLNKLVSKLPDRSSTTTGRIIMPNKDKVPAETVALLAGKNWHLTTIIVSYKFDSNVYEDMVPIFSNGFDGKYIVVDTNNSKGVITRNIESAEGKLPDYIRFGRLNSTQPENGCLLEICDMNTDNLVTTEHMFDWCANLTKVNTKHFNTSKVTNMVSMFYQCEKLASIDVSNFDTSKVVNMSHLFGKCKLLTSLDVSNWDTSEVRIMEHLFAQCESLTSIDVSNFDTHNVWNMYDMFCDCHTLSTLDVSNFDTSKVTEMSGVFARCYNLTDLDVSNWTADSVLLFSNLLSNTNGLLTKITVNNLEIANMIISYIPDRTGKEAGTLAYYDINEEDINLEALQAKNWNLSYEPIMAKYIFDSNSFENFLPVTPSYAQSNYEVIDDVKADGRIVRTLKYKTSNRPSRIVFGNSSSAFASSGILSLLDVLYVDIKDNIINMNNLFAKAENVTRINTRNWDTSNVATLYCAFYVCMSLKHLEVGHFKTDKVNDMTFIFYNNKVLESVDVTNWNTSNVTQMYGIFAGSPLFKELDLSNWDFSKVENANALFMGCSSLETLNISNFNINTNLSIQNMFGGADSLSLVNVNNCSADVINLLLSHAPNRVNKNTIKFYALHNTKEHASLDKATADAKNLKVVIRGGNIKAIHVPENAFNSIALGNNILFRHVHIGERFL